MFVMPPKAGPTAPDAVFKALGSPARLTLVRTLTAGERCVCELTGTLDAAQSRLSFHLKTLKDAGMVTDRREGRWVYYTLAPDALEMVQAALVELATPTSPRRKEWWACCK